MSDSTRPIPPMERRACWCSMRRTAPIRRSFPLLCRSPCPCRHRREVCPRLCFPAAPLPSSPAPTRQRSPRTARRWVPATGSGPSTSVASPMPPAPCLRPCHAYITQNVTARGGQIAGHDLWLVDTQGMSLVTHRLDADSADTVLANAIGGTSSATPATCLLRGGDAYILTPALRSAPALWLSLGDGHHIVQL